MSKEAHRETQKKEAGTIIDDIDQVFEYLTTRLGCVVRLNTQRVHESFGLTKIGKPYTWYHSHEFRNTDFGIFSHVFSKCKLILRCYETTYKGHTVHNIEPHLSYTHHDGGTNGCSLGFYLVRFPNGRLLEVQE